MSEYVKKRRERWAKCKCNYAINAGVIWTAENEIGESPDTPNWSAHMFIDGSVEMAFGFSEKEAVSNLVTRDRILRRVAEEQRVMIDWEREIKMGEKRLMQKK